MRTNPMRQIITQIVKNHDPQAPTEWQPVVISRRPQGTFQPVSNPDRVKTQYSDVQTQKPCQDIPNLWQRFQKWSVTFWGDLVIGLLMLALTIPIGYLLIWAIMAMWGY